LPGWQRGELDRVPPLTPALASAFSHLREEVLGYLDDSENITFEDLPAQATTTIQTLAGVARTLLAEHRPDANGCCSTCPPTSVAWRYSAAVWPCPVVNTIYRFLSADHRTQIRNASE
jgi:hypothetical protein